MSRKAPHWIIARLALARSLQMPQFPDEELRKPVTRDRAYEIHMEQLTGENNPSMEDFTDDYRLLLSIYHGVDLFADRTRFIELLQRHIQRGMTEIRASWREGNDFHDYLYQEMFFERASGSQPAAPTDLSARLRRALGEIGVGAEVEKVAAGPRLTRFTLRLAAASDLDRLRKDLDKIPFELGIDRTEGLPVCPGVDVLGQPVIFDLAEAPHLFVAGTTGSGKSVCMHALLLSLLASGRNVRLGLIDPKEVEFAAYAGCKRLWGDKVVTEAAEAGEMLDGLVAEMDVRQKILAGLGVANLAEVQADKRSALPRVVVVVDELADLLMQRPDSETALIRLAQKARAVGIHLVLATRRPGSDTFPGLLRSNVPSRIALSVRSGQESRIILDELGAEKLLGRGDMLVRLSGRPTIRAHGARVDQGDIKRWL